MANKGISFLEEHIEKLVLAVIGLASVMILILRVLISPNYIEFDNQKFSPSEIDKYVRSKLAEPLVADLERFPRSMGVYDPNVDEFMAKMHSAISNVDVSLYLPQPFIMSEKSDGRIYDLPVVGELSSVSAEHLRAVAYIPTEEVDEDNTYESVANEPNDLDLVTVEAQLDIAGLYDRFYECFAGPGVREDWRDPCLAHPVFTAVQLQRKELLDDGTWSDWQNVPRTQIDHRKHMFTLIEKVGDLPPGGVKVRMLQFDNKSVASDLLQPQAYKIASADEEWFPPTLYRKYMKTVKDIEFQEKQEARAAEKEKLEEERRSLRSERSRSSSSSTGGSGFEEFLSTIGRSGGYDSDSTTGRRTKERGSRRSDEQDSERSRPRRSRDDVQTERKQRPAPVREQPKTLSTSDIYDQLEETLIAEVDLKKMDKGLLFWAHDDTVRTNASYRYRIRLGLFNPIAGTDWFSEPYKEYRDDVILWSDYSPETEQVDIPGMLYFFPYSVTAKTVKVQVSRFALGYWYSEDFNVKQGELIGKTIEPHPLKEEEQGVTIPEMIDCSTGAVLVDTVAVNDWLSGSGLRQRAYYDMLYSYDGATIEHMPAERRYWPEELAAKYNEIKRLEKEAKKPLRPWTGDTTDRSYRPSFGGDQESGSGDQGFEDFLKTLRGR